MINNFVFLEVNGWIKSTFQRTHHKSGQAAFGIGAVTNGQMKLEVRITTLFEEKALRKGQAVQVTGIIKTEGCIYLQVENGSAIVPTSGVEMESDEMINITVTPQKVCVNDFSPNNNVNINFSLIICTRMIFVPESTDRMK